MKFSIENNIQFFTNTRNAKFNCFRSEKNIAIHKESRYLEGKKTAKKFKNKLNILN
jgi:hypothetical protein